MLGKVKDFPLSQLVSGFEPRSIGLVSIVITTIVYC